jgi:hypothetical protein
MHSANTMKKRPGMMAWCVHENLIVQVNNSVGIMNLPTFKEHNRNFAANLD